jgi:hypothetical protein
MMLSKMVGFHFTSTVYWRFGLKGIFHVAAEVANPSASMFWPLGITYKSISVKHSKKSKTKFI